MDFVLESRVIKGKGELKRLRRDSIVPAILALLDGNCAPVMVKKMEFEKILRHVPRGRLSTHLFSVEYKSNVLKVLVQDIQYQRIGYQIEHLDLVEVLPESRVKVHIPLSYTGVDLCAGVKQGGQLKPMKRAVKVCVRVADMPSSFFVDVSTLQLGAIFRVKDLEIIHPMQILDKKDQVLFAIGK